MFNPRTFARIADKYYEENNICRKCGGSLKCCHDETTEKKDA